MPKWMGRVPSFAEFKAKLLDAFPDVSFEEIAVPLHTGTRTGGRFVRTLASGKRRTTTPFFPDDSGRTFGAGAAASFCKALDIDGSRLGLDDDW
jgi:hypothetical protein